MPAPAHHCRVLASPWPGVYATEIASERHYGRHSHGTFGFGVVDHGAHRSASGRGTVDAHAGDIVTTNPGELHDGRPLGGPSRSWRTVYVTPATLQSLQPQATQVEIAQPVLADPALRGAILALLATLRDWQDGHADALRCEEALVAAGGLLLARHASRRHDPGCATIALAQVRERIAADLQQPPSLAELAALAGISRFQLLRRFAAVHGCTPHAWLVQQRTERARGLIARGLPLAEAAAGSGFADQSHMNRLFVRQFGFTPGAWQRAARRPQ